MRHRQPHAPDAGLALAELDEPADLERLERREPEAHPGDRARRGRARRRCTPPSPTRPPVAAASPPHASAPHACARCGRPRRARTARAARARPGRRPPRCPARSTIPSSGCASRSRATSSCERRLRRAAPSGRAAAAARGAGRAARPAARPSRARAPRRGSGASLETTSRTPNSRWITPSCTSRARSIRSCSWRAARRWNVAWRAASASAAGLPSVHSRSRSSSDSGRARPAVGEDHAAPAAAGRQRAADERRAVEQVAEALGHLARDRLGVHLDHAVLDERLARDRRRLDGHVRVGEAVEVEPVRARRAHAPARLVVAEDHRAVHRGEPAHRLAQRRVERVGGAVGLRAREQLDERLERRPRARRARARRSRSHLRIGHMPHHDLPASRLR